MAANAVSVPAGSVFNVSRILQSADAPGAS
jgi:hypothetical protein